MGLLVALPASEQANRVRAEAAVASRPELALGVSQPSRDRLVLAGRVGQDSIVVQFARSTNV